MAERYQMQSSPFNNMPIHKFIPMEKFDFIQPNEVRILYYQNPSQFYVYLRQKINTHAQFQVELQRAMQNYQSILPSPEYQRFQPVVAQDNHKIWHRATISKDFDSDSTKICVYFVDVGQEENISITNIRPLPSEFIRQPAFAIPCRLYGIYPLNGNEQSPWKMDDPVHDQFNKLMANNASCKVCDIKEQICYDVEIDIPKVGDLGTFLFEQNLVSRINMRTTQPPPPQQSFGRVPPGFSGIQQPTSRLLQKPIVQQSPSSPVSNNPSSDIYTLPPQDGHYIITHVYNPIEFYGHSQVRKKELDELHKRLETIYNNNGNDQSLSVHFLMEGVPCVIQQGEQYHRVTIKHRESESRVLVKLVDRGDEILVDTSELLQLEKKYFTIPAFAQPFRLHNYDESNNTANITRKLKRLILNQRVYITQQLPMINGFYPVEVKLSDNQLVNQILLSNDINPVVSHSNSPPIRPIEIQTTIPQRTNEDLPPPQKLLTAPSVTNRFPSNERFSRPQQQEEPVNGHQSSMPEQNRPYNRGFSNDRNGNNNNRGGSFGDRISRNNDENDNQNGGQRTGGFNNNRGGGFGDRIGRNNDDNDNQNGGQKTGGFNNNRGGGFGDRGGRSYENNGQRTGGFNNNRGARNGDFQDRNNRFRNNQDEDNNRQRFGNRGGFQNYRDRGEDGGDNARRGGFGDRGGSRGGRGGFNSRGNRGGFGDRGENGFRSISDNNEPMKTFSGWPNVKSTASPFEAGDNFIENEIPKERFEFVLSHIEKSNDFFIQLFSKENELSQLTETLQIEYKDAPELNINSIKVNQACLAKSSDDCWYRAIVLATSLTKIKVRFIDFGDTNDVDIRKIRQLAKKFCLTSPYAYRCTFKNVENNENINTNEIIDKCAEKRFNGKIEKKTLDNKYILQSEDFEKLMIDIKAIKKNNSCLIVYIDSDKHQFYIQDDHQTMEKIDKEVINNDELLPEEFNLNSMVISTYDNEPYRAIIQSDLDENVSVYFVDYGNTNICSKSSLKKCNEQLKSYPYQAKRCELYDVSINDLDQAFEQLNEYIESDKTEISIINQDENLFNVRLYIDGECFNEKFSNEISIDIDDQSNTTTATTVKEEERPISATGKRNNEEILSPVGNSLTTTTNTKRQKSESETEANSMKYHEGVLTYVDKNKPNVYLQLLPESESNLEQINDLIDVIVQEDKHNSSYEIGDHVIAQFTEDNNHYRARIESYSTSTELYTVYFIDYGNFDENVPKDHLYSYSNELKNIEPQVHVYTLENLSSNRLLIEEKLNDTIEFYFIDEINSIINIKSDNNENKISNQPKTFTANISGTNKDCFYIHILPDTDTLICEMDELLQSHSKEHNQLNSWNINDLCIIFDNEQNQYFRGKILSINNEQYDIQCIDYGNILSNIKFENIYLLNNNDLIKQNPLARQCRLHGVNDKDQYKAIEEIIRNINPTERVTITVENDQNDQCMFVMLFRDNHEIVNDRYIKQDIDFETKNRMSTNSSDSAIDTSNDQQGASPIGIPQAESTHQYGDTTNLTSTINQTIDFGENDPSTSNTTITDEIEN